MEPQLVLTGRGGMNALRKQSTTVSGLQKQQESVHCLSSNLHDIICAIFLGVHNQLMLYVTMYLLPV